MGGNVLSDIGRGVSGVFTLGGSEIARNNLGSGNILSKALQTPGMIFTGGTSGGFGGNRDPGAPVVGGKQSPLDILTSSGGAPLLGNIALGAKVDDALASYFGVSPDNWETYKQSLTPSELSSINGLSTQLNEIQSNTEMRNNAVTQLVNDFPNYMADAIPRYKGIIDSQTEAAANQALANVAAKYGASGGFSSGAMLAATARTAATTAQGNTEAAGNLALQDWQQKYNATSALAEFQRKMLGQGASEGFNAVQNALNNNATADRDTAKYANDRATRDSNSENAMFGALGNTAASLGMAAITKNPAPLLNLGKQGGNAGISNDASAGDFNV